MYEIRFVSCVYRKESIKIGPPLTISIEALKEGLEILDNSIGKIFNESKH